MQVFEKTREEMIVENQGSIIQLKKRIEAIRSQLHSAFQNKRTFSDPDVYLLSVYLDDLIAEYQNCIRMDRGQKKSLSEKLKENFLQNIELYPLYQRIVRLTNPLEEYAYEATIRGRTANGKEIPPSVLFQQSEGTQMLIDYKARHIAIREACPLVTNTSLLFLNGHALSLQAGFIFENVAKLEVPINQLVLEITEQTRIDNVGLLKQELTALRALGMKVALDDFGAGFSNFWLVEELEPEYIKLDRSIIAKVDQSIQARRVIEGMVVFAEKANTQLISEGIERETQRDILVELGVTYGQGFFLGYPFALTPESSAVRERSSS